MADKAFSVICARSKLTVEVGEKDSILDALLMEGIDALSSCQQGVCGTCETRVLQGVPDHRDMLLSDEEHASNKTMLICCSRSQTDTLTLDI